VHHAARRAYSRREPPGVWAGSRSNRRALTNTASTRVATPCRRPLRSQPTFEWWATEQVNHTYASIVANQWTARFFVNEARKNLRAFPNADAENDALIWNCASGWHPRARASVPRRAECRRAARLPSLFPRRARR
jgi:hypothetical protein